MTGILEVVGSALVSLSPGSTFIGTMVVKATIVLAIGCLVAGFARKADAALRHAVWALTLAAALGLPLGMIATPAWRVAVLPPVAVQPGPAEITPSASASPTTEARSAANALPPSARSSASPADKTAGGTGSASITEIAGSLGRLLPLAWVLGAFAVLVWMIVGRLALRRLARRSLPLDSPAWLAALNVERQRAGVSNHVSLLSSESVSTPLTWGIRSPVIVLPDESAQWSDDHRSVVLRHELAHIARADTLIQMLGVAAVALYWFNPLVWIAARGLRAEQERACDDMVLVSGTPPVEYAAHLLEVARSARALGPQGFVSLAMARPSQLEGRLLAVLNAPRHRVRISPASRKFALATAALAFVTLSAFTPISRAAAALPRVAVPTIIASQFITSSSPVAATRKEKWAPPVPQRAALDSQILKWTDVAPQGTLELDLETGAGLTISSWNESRVEVRGTLGGRNWRDTEVSLERTSTGARLVSRLRDKYGNQSTRHHFDIRLPSRYNLRISSAGGGISISNLNGEFIGHTGGGEIRIDNSNGRAELTTGGGSIRVTSSNLSGSVTTGGGTVVIQDVNGGLVGHSGSMGTVYAKSNGRSSTTSVSVGGKSISASNEPNYVINGVPIDNVGERMPRGNIIDDDGSVTIGSGANVTIDERTGEIRASDGRVIYRKSGGRINVDEAMRGADVRTGGGSVTIGRSAGDVIAHTGGGDVNIGPLSGSAEAHTGAGDVAIEFRAVRSPSADVKTGNGRVTITLPADFTGTLDLETAYTNNHGRRTAIQSDWPLKVTETSQWDDRNGTPRKYVRARQAIGSGRGVIRVQTVNGDVVIRRGR